MVAVSSATWQYDSKYRQEFCERTCARVLEQGETVQGCRRADLSSELAERYPGSDIGGGKVVLCEIE